MIDLSRTRTELLAEIGARDSIGAPLNDLMDPRALQPEAHLSVRGHTRDALFPLLEVVLSERFAAAPRSQLIRDLLVPLKNALGNAYKHGNSRDRARSITVEIFVTAKGALLAITDEGPGFDVDLALQRSRQGEHEASHRGAGLRSLDRAHSTVTYEDGGRTVLLRFLSGRSESETSSAFPFPRAGTQTTPGRQDTLADDPTFQQVTDEKWMQRFLSEELQELREGGSQVEACRVYTNRGLDFDGNGFRISLRARGPHAHAAEPRILTGRLHPNETSASAEFAAATKLHALRSKALRIPRVVWRTRAPRLVLHEFAPWMNLWEYLADRGSPHVLRSTAERVGEALAELHQSQIAFGKFDCDTVEEPLQVLGSRVSSHLALEQA